MDIDLIVAGVYMNSHSRASDLPVLKVNLSKEGFEYFVVLLPKPEKQLSIVNKFTGYLMHR